MIYCMQAHEDKISPKCAFELGDAAASVQTTADVLKDGVIACKAEIAGVCGKTVPGQGRIADMSDCKQIDGFERLRRSHQEDRSHGGPIRTHIVSDGSRPKEP